MADKNQNDGVRVVHIPEEVRRMTAAEVMANPPKFPLLKGEEDRQIIERIIELTEKDELVWEITLRKLFEAAAFYRGLDFELRSMVSSDNVSGASVVTSISIFNKNASLNSSLQSELLEELKDAVIKQRERVRGSNPTHKNFGEIIWDILN